MARIELAWDGKHFHTDCNQCAAMFVRSSDSFIPRSSGAITAEVRDVLLQMLAEPPNGHLQNQKAVNGVTITLRNGFFRL